MAFDKIDKIEKRLASSFIVAVLVLFLVVVVGAKGQPASPTQPKPTNIPIDLTAAEVEADLSTNTASSTKRLIATLEGLQSKVLYYLDSQPSEEERMKGPPMYNEFVKITNELANRGGESVWQGFEQILVEDKLGEDEKKIIRDCFHAKTGKDAPFTLLACDRTQTRQYCLLFDPKKCNSLTIRQGDILTQIARKAYPKLSKWDGIDIIVFINDLKNQDSIQAGQTISIYEYKIIKNEPAQ